MKKILILGAGVYQQPLIKEAKKHGHYVIVASIKGKYPGFKLADKIYHIDTTNKSAILQIAQIENIDAICTTGTDVAVETIGYVCDRLNLPGISEVSAILSTNKAKMKEAFQNNKVRTATYRRVSTYKELHQAYTELTKPVMMKIVDSSGSRGIIKIENEIQLKENLDLLKTQTKQEYIIVEECIVGEEFGAEAIIHNGKIEYLMPHGDILFHGKTDVPIGHYMPFNLENHIYDDMVTQIENSLIALKLKDCIINADLILSNDEIYVLEIGARAGATNLPELTSIYNNMNYYKYILDLALGKCKAVTIDTKEHQACSSMLLYTDKDGVISSIKDTNKDIEYYEFELDYIVGDKIKKFEVGPDRIGHIIIKTSKTTTQEIVDEINTIANNVKVELQE